MGFTKLANVCRSVHKLRKIIVHTHTHRTHTQTHTHTHTTHIHTCMSSFWFFTYYSSTPDSTFFLHITSTISQKSSFTCSLNDSFISGSIRLSYKNCKNITDTMTKLTMELTRERINKHMLSLLSAHLVRQTQCSLDF